MSKTLFQWLQERHGSRIYRRAGTGWVSYQPRLNQGVLEHKVTAVASSDRSEHVREQVRVMPKGLAHLAELMAKKRMLERVRRAGTVGQNRSPCRGFLTCRPASPGVGLGWGRRMGVGVKTNAGWMWLGIGLSALPITLMIASAIHDNPERRRTATVPLLESREEGPRTEYAAAPAPESQFDPNTARPTEPVGDALPRPKTDAGKARIERLGKDPYWQEILGPWVARNANVVRELKGKLIFVLALNTAADMYPNGTNDELLWVVDCLMVKHPENSSRCELPTGASSGLFDDVLPARSQGVSSSQPLVISEAEFERINAAVARQPQVATDARIQAKAMADEWEARAALNRLMQSAQRTRPPPVTMPAQAYAAPQPYVAAPAPAYAAPAPTPAQAPTRYVDTQGREVFGAVPLGPNAYVEPATGRTLQTFDRGDGVQQTYDGQQPRRTPLDAYNQFGAAVDGN